MVRQGLFHRPKKQGPPKRPRARQRNHRGRSAETIADNMHWIGGLLPVADSVLSGGPGSQNSVRHIGERAPPVFIQRHLNPPMVPGSGSRSVQPARVAN